MHNYILLAQSDVGGRALIAWTRLFALPDRDRMVFAPIVFDECKHRIDSEISRYEFVLKQIESRLEGIDSRRATILVDAVRPSGLSLVRGSASWESLIAMLVITFPELRWMFGYDGLAEERDRLSNVRIDFTEDEKTIFEGVFAGHDRYSAFHPWFDPLFDPTGLRELVRLQTNLDLERMSVDAGNLNTPFQLPRRRELSAVIEDEFDYAMLHSYTAYRFGFRTDVLNSWEQMEERFNVRSPKNPSANPRKFPATLSIEERHKYRLILEDMRLQFADKSAKTHLSRLDEREIQCNRLWDENDDSDFRFMISTGQESASDELWALNEGYLYNKRHGVGKLFPKPIGGPFELWRTTELTKQLESGKADGFVSPPAKTSDERYSGHGAPGKLALVAGKLIDRSRRIAAKSDSPSGFILSAVLANDAFEMLGGKTPTMSLEAIKLKHVAEVRAECSFIGAGFHSDLGDRFQEIYRFVESTCRWFHPSVRRAAELDAKATMCNELVKIYDEAGQAEERDYCLAQFRWNNRRLELLEAWRRRNPIDLGLNCLLLYAELLLGSLKHIIIAFACWIAVFFLVTKYFVAMNQDLAVVLATQFDWMVGGAASGIESLEKSTTSDVKARYHALISIAANIVGVFHFGILISFFYSLISRK